MTNAAELECDLCIVGAGYAALNGLNAAAKYLKPGSRVVLIDKNQTWGGQWIKQHDFVRLHQPYRMFTAGDQPWALSKDPSYLATRREVLDYLAGVPKSRPVTSRSSRCSATRIAVIASARPRQRWTPCR